MGRKELNNSYIKLSITGAVVSVVLSHGGGPVRVEICRDSAPRNSAPTMGVGGGGAEMEEHFCSNYFSFFSSCYIKMLEACCNLYLYQMHVLYPGYYKLDVNVKKLRESYSLINSEGALFHQSLITYVFEIQGND